MNVAVIELTPRGHITLVETVVKVFLSDVNNNIRLFTTSHLAQELEPNIREYGNRVTVELLSDPSGVPQLLDAVSTYKPDRTYIVTLENYLPDFVRWKPEQPTHVFIHNIKDWFETSWPNRISRFFGSSLSLKNIKYTLKTQVLYPGYRKKIFKTFTASGGKAIVLNSNLKQRLAAYIPADQSEE